MVVYLNLRDGNINVLVSRTGPLTNANNNEGLPVSAGLAVRNDEINWIF
jgi:hypothetical protein